MTDLSTSPSAKLTPFALKDTPALIERVFPAQKVSFEAQKERKAVQGQTLTGLGSYWKGRKPLILARAIVLGSLMPTTENPEKDLSVFEKLMAFDDDGLAKRALAANAFSARKIQEIISISNPEYYFGPSGRTWQRSIGEEEKLELYRLALDTFATYEEKAGLGKRPEELDQDWLLKSVWPIVNDYYADLGVCANSIAEFVEQLGILRFGRLPKIGDTFSGGGSIPYEAARMGCDVYASDLNPIACMLTWGAMNIVGAESKRRKKIEKAQRTVIEAVEEKVTHLGVEHDELGNRAKAYLYCSEVKCPETGWMVPVSPNWVISQRRKTIAVLTPNHQFKRFDIKVKNNATADEFAAAAKGSIQRNELVYSLNGKTYRTPIRTLRGDYQQADGTASNQLRRWEKSDFKPLPTDVFQERLYAIQWITKNSIDQTRQETFFAAPTEADMEREKKVETIVEENLLTWQAQGLVPDMMIESGYNTDQPIRERGWTYWHHFFNPRQLLALASFKEEIDKAERPQDLYLSFAKTLDWINKGCYFGTGAARESISHLFANQALNVLWNYGSRSVFASYPLLQVCNTDYGAIESNKPLIKCTSASTVKENCDIWITDPPYADAVNYHEITEFFIAWLRKNPPKPFDEWIWDSRRALAIKGSGDDFRRGMIDAYKNMAEHMPDNGMQCVMFTHQDTGVWSDMVGIFWAAGLQVVSAWYIATETTSELKKGGYVQGTVILMLKKRPVGERTGFKQRLLPAVRTEVQRQIETMMRLSDKVENTYGEPVFNDSDLQMAGYAAALKVLTAYTHIGGEDVTTFALRPRKQGEDTVVDEIVQEAAEAANNLLVPEGLAPDTWAKLRGIERFVLRMLDMETTGAKKLDNYQNFAKAFRVEDYTQVMASMAANGARLKTIPEFGSRDLGDSTELGASHLGQLFIGLQQILKDIEPASVVKQLQAVMNDFLEIRPVLVDLLKFIEKKSSEENVQLAAEVLGARLQNLRFGD